MQLHFKKTGNSGSVILILHGLFGNSRNWQSIATHLANEHQVYCLDLRNHGLSPHSDNMTYQLMADDIIQFITEHNLSLVSIIGHSMGGKVAMYLAINSPSLIDKLAIVDIAPVVYQHDFADIFKGLFNIPLAEIKSREEAESYLAGLVVNKQIRQFLLQNLQLNKLVGGERKNYWKFNLPVLNDSVKSITGFPFTIENSPEINKFVNKSLFISGQNSDYINSTNEKEIRHFFSSPRLITVKGAGHWVHAEKPDIIKKILSAFFKHKA